MPGPRVVDMNVLGTSERSRLSRRCLKTVSACLSETARNRASRFVPNSANALLFSYAEGLRTSKKSLGGL